MKTLSKLLICLLVLWTGPVWAQTDFSVNAKYMQTAHAFTIRDQSFAHVEVGDKTAKDFKPHLRLKKWDGECEIGIQLQHDEKAPTVTTGAGKIKWQGKKVEAHFYDNGLVENKGGYEFEVVLKEKPVTNKVIFDINTRGLDFLYQPPLANLSPDGSTWEDNGHGGQCSRPANVNGSYAVYHKTMAGDYSKMGGKNYKTGKAFHIYRPRIEDATGAWVWGSLSIDEKAGLLTVTIPQDFLDKAVYPVRHAAGLEFGYHTVGGSDDSLPNGYYSATKSPNTPASNGTLSSISIYCSIHAGSPNFCPALYSDVAGVPTTRLAYLNSGGTTVGASLGWVTTNLSYASITAGTQYWLGQLTSVASSNTNFKFDTAIAAYCYTNDPTWPTVWAFTFILNQKMSFYATYTAPVTTSGNFFDILGN